MISTLPGEISANNVTIEKIDVNTNEVIETYKSHNRLVLRYHLVITHLLSPVGNFANQSNFTTEEFAKFGNPTSEDLKLTKMRFGTNATEVSVTDSGVITPVLPRFNADGSTITDGTDYYAIDTYRFLNGNPVNSVPDYDQSLEVEATMSGPAGNSTTVDQIVYREAGLYTDNDILFARVTFPAITKDESFAFKFRWILSLP